jgi:protein-disulfide isomerase
MSEEEEPDEDTGSETTPEEETDSSGNESERTVTLSVNAVIIGAFVVGLAIGFAGGVLASQGGMVGLEAAPTGNTDTGSPTGEPSDTGTDSQEQETIDMSEIEMEGEPVLGESDAPVTMVMYEDFECPFCKRFEDNAFPQIKENYIDTGQVKAVWKDRPLPRLHPWAEPAAAAMECVYREGGNEAFWNVKNQIFANQKQLSTSNVESQITSWASEQGVSESAVQSCLENGNPMDEVNADSQEGLDIGASGTPTIFIDGQKIVGAQPYSNFESAIEEALN